MKPRFTLCHIGSVFFILFFLSETCIASVRKIGQIHLGFQGSQMNWVDNNGLFLLSNNSNYAFGFTTTSEDVTLFMLVVVHITTSRVIWTANIGYPIHNFDKFVFDKNGNVYFESGGTKVWFTNTADKGATSMELQNTGNLVLWKDRSLIWESFSHPTDTLLSGQEFRDGMKLTSAPNSGKISYYLEIQAGDMLLYAGFESPQPYWSIRQENRKTVNQIGGDVDSATLESNSWRFFDRKKGLIWQFIFSSNSNSNATWAAVLGRNGLISFYHLQLQDGVSSTAESTKIPQDSCSTPESCNPYYVCSGDNQCQCPAVLSSYPNCDPGVFPSCKNSIGQMQMINVSDRVNYFALPYVHPVSKSDLTGCKNACLENCSCHVIFFDTSSENCYMFDQIGSLQYSKQGSFISYIKVSGDNYSGRKGEEGEDKRFPYVIIIVIGTIIIIAGLIYMGYRYHKKKMRLPDQVPDDDFEEDNFLLNLSGTPVRFSFRELEEATNNFTVKLGQGGFGSVYRGELKDGSQLAVKKLEGVGQGTKEFRAEVSTIGSIHHIHLVKLKGFCAEGTHRLLVYEFMSNGSLDKWIFRKNTDESFMLDWETRYNIALGTAKGLAYLHEDCDSKIVHCDIKPENVLLDDNFLAKVSDFGLAKLMTREQSHVFTTLRGTRGYLAPEWITNYAISEKSDVYSFGMVLLEIIGGRKNFDQSEKSEKAHFPSFALKMAEEGKLVEVIDPCLKITEDDERLFNTIKVALWCIQEDMYLRPSMSKVVQMLEGICIIPQPPTISQMGYRHYSSVYKAISDDGTSSGPSDCNSDAYLSAVRLSGPR